MAEIISITRDKIIGNLGLQIMPKNKIGLVEIDSVDFKRDEKFEFGEYDLNIYNEDILNITKTGYEPIKEIKTYYFETSEEYPEGNMEDFNYNPDIYENHRISEYVEGFTVKFDVVTDDFILPFDEFNEEIPIQDVYNYIYCEYETFSTKTTIQYDSILDIQEQIVHNTALPSTIVKRVSKTGDSISSIGSSYFNYEYGNAGVRILSLTRVNSKLITIEALILAHANVRDIRCVDDDWGAGGYFLHDDIQKDYYIQNINFTMIGKGFSRTDTKYKTETPQSNYRAINSISIENSFINNLTLIKGVPATNKIMGELFYEYKKGRPYGNFTTSYTEFRDISYNIVYSGKDGELLKVGDIIEFSDFLPKKLYIITSVEFNANSGLVEVQFIKKIREDKVICSNETICLDTLII